MSATKSSSLTHIEARISIDEQMTPHLCNVLTCVTSLVYVGLRNKHHTKCNERGVCNVFRSMNRCGAALVGGGVLDDGQPSCLEERKPRLWRLRDDGQMGGTGVERVALEWRGWNGCPWNGGGGTGGVRAEGQRALEAGRERLKGQWESSNG